MYTCAYILLHNLVSPVIPPGQGNKLVRMGDNNSTQICLFFLWQRNVNTDSLGLLSVYIYTHSINIACNSRLPQFLLPKQNCSAGDNSAWWSLGNLWYSSLIMMHIPLCRNYMYIYAPRTTVTQDELTRFSEQLDFAKFLSNIKGNF